MESSADGEVIGRLVAAEEFEESLTGKRVSGRVRRAVKRRGGYPADRSGLEEWWRKVLRQQGVSGEVLGRVLAEGLAAERPYFGPDGAVQWGADHGVRLQFYREAAKALGVYPESGGAAGGGAAAAGGVVVRLTPGLQGADVDGEVAAYVEARVEGGDQDGGGGAESWG